MDTDQRSGLLQGISAYIMWGLFPLYWYFLAHIPAIESIANRIIWSFIFLAVFLTIKKRWATVTETLRDAKTFKLLILTGFLISGNWLLYIWAISNGYVLEASMGYYINPIVNIVLGAMFLGERLRKYQYVAVAFVVAGVIVLTAKFGRIPYVAITLAVTFAFYALLRKIIPVGAQVGLLIETGVVVVPAMIFLVSLGKENHVAFGSITEQFLLLGAGLITLIPLIFLANALKKLQLSTIGFIQYISPTLQFLCGLFLFEETFSIVQAVSFILIWIGLFFYTVEAIFVAKAVKIGKQ